MFIDDYDKAREKISFLEYSSDVQTSECEVNGAESEDYRKMKRGPPQRLLSYDDNDDSDDSDVIVPVNKNLKHPPLTAASTSAQKQSKLNYIKIIIILLQLLFTSTNIHVLSPRLSQLHSSPNTHTLYPSQQIYYRPGLFSQILSQIWIPKLI